MKIISWQEACVMMTRAIGDAMGDPDMFVAVFGDLCVPGLKYLPTTDEFEFDEDAAKYKISTFEIRRLLTLCKEGLVCDDVSRVLSALGEGAISIEDAAIHISSTINNP